MADSFIWSEVGRWIWGAVRNRLPQRLLRWAWSDQEITNSTHIVHFEQWPRFHVRAEREPPVLEGVGFNLFNFTPFRFLIVGADLRVSVDGYEWITQRERLPSAIPVEALSRSGYYFKHVLSESQARKLRERQDPLAQIRIGGHLVLKGVFGELRKEIHSDVVATIDR